MQHKLLSYVFIINRSAFCCVRPPGHHAESNKAGGFCFVNNAGVGAKYARNTYNLDRVAVLDFDVHHGNNFIIFNGNNFISFIHILI